MSWPDRTIRRIRWSRLLKVNPQRADGTSTRFVPVGFVVVGNDLYVRSMSATGLWYRRALTNGVGTIRVWGRERDVTFHDAADGPHDLIDAAYARKYWIAGRRTVQMITNVTTHPLTVRIDTR